MALEMNTKSDWWFARFLINGKVLRVNLGVEISGRRPRAITETGDGKFERSRSRAQATHDHVPCSRLSQQ